MEKKSKNKIHICPCKGKMCSFGFCTDCNHFERYYEGSRNGTCELTGESRNYGEPCNIDKWTPIT